MNFNKALFVLVFSAMAVSGFQACTSKNPAENAVSKNAAEAAKGEARTSKCPDGSDPIQVPGVCEGTWRPMNASKNGPAAAECHFIGQLVNCKTLGHVNFAGDGRDLCYGESVFPFGGQTVTADQCLKKHGMPSHESKYSLSCCNQ